MLSSASGATALGAGGSAFVGSAFIGSALGAGASALGAGASALGAGASALGAGASALKLTCFLGCGFASGSGKGLVVGVDGDVSEDTLTDAVSKMALRASETRDLSALNTLFKAVGTVLDELTPTTGAEGTSTA